MVCGSYRKPGGGPAPIFRNPAPGRLAVVGGVHCALFSLALTAVVVPALLDVGGEAMSMFVYLSFMLGLSVTVTLYFLFMARKDLGTEVEWGRLVGITTFLVLSEAGASAWSIVLLFNFMAETNKFRLDMVLVMCVSVGTLICMLFCVFIFVYLIRSIHKQGLDMTYLV